MADSNHFEVPSDLTHYDELHLNPPGFQFVDYATFFDPIHPLKRWDDKERVLVTKLLDHLTDKFPNLVTLSTAGNPLMLCRTDRIKVRQPLLPGQDAWACITSREIYFSDIFFKDINCYEVIAHELAHGADSGGRIAYSRDWVEFAEPRILQVKAMIQEFGPSEALKERIRTSGLLPSLNASKNLEESFAEFFAAKVANPNFSLDFRFQKFADRLLAPSADDLNWSKCFKSGVFYYQQKKYIDAMSEFQKAVRIDQRVAMPHIYLARSLMQVGRPEASIVEANLALDCLSEAHVPTSEALKSTLLDFEGIVLQELGQLQRAKYLLDQCLAELPSDETALIARAACNEKLGHFGAASQDLCSLMSLRKNWRSNTDRLLLRTQIDRLRLLERERSKNTGFLYRQIKAKLLGSVRSTLPLQPVASESFWFELSTN